MSPLSPPVGAWGEGSRQQWDDPMVCQPHAHFENGHLAGLVLAQALEVLDNLITQGEDAEMRDGGPECFQVERVLVIRVGLEVFLA